MYKIGEFSQITEISIKALHYYDKENIIKPACRKDNSYRFYDEENYTRAILVKKLRSYDFSIAEIKEVISICKSEEDLQYILTEKINNIQEEINRKKHLMDKISQAIKTVGPENTMDENEVNIVSIPSVRIASIKYNGAHNKCGEYFSKIAKSVGENINGPFMNLYYDLEYCEVANIESCVSVKNEFNNRDIRCYELPSIKAISYVHNGSYDTLNQAYKKIFDYAQSNDIELMLPSREIYHEGPGLIFKGNPNNYKTEVIYPIKESEEA